MHKLFLLCSFCCASRVVFTTFLWFEQCNIVQSNVSFTVAGSINLQRNLVRNIESAKQYVCT